MHLDLNEEEEADTGDLGEEQATHKEEQKPRPCDGKDLIYLRSRNTNGDGQ